MSGNRARRLGLALLFVVCATAVARADDADLVKRGEYLARAGDCFACHSKKDGPAFAGGDSLETPFGKIYAPNITPDKETGIGAWTDDDFYRAMHDGIRKDGKYLYPAFPFPWYTNVTREDALAIKAFLFTQKPVHAPAKPLGFTFPFNVREALLTWRTLFFKKGNPPEAAPKPGDSVARGKYLVEGLGHCGECHNHRNVLGASDWSGRLQGGAVDGWYAPNITSDGRQGVGSWSEDEIAKFLKGGVGPHGSIALGPMQETISESLRYLSDQDLHAMAAYLKSVQPKETFANSEGGYDKAGAPGQTLYQEHCASCHGLKGEGVAGQVPALAHNGAVVAQGPQNIIRVVLGGHAAEQGLAPMPAIGADLSDAEVADVVDYVRNTFGNAAPATTTAGQVEQLRSKVSTPMLAAQRSDCEPPQTPEAKALISDGSVAGIAKASAVDLLPAIDALVGKLNPSDPVQADRFVTDLTGAYCAALFDKGEPAPQRANDLGRFADLAYSRIQPRISPRTSP